MSVVVQCLTKSTVAANTYAHRIIYTRQGMHYMHSLTGVPPTLCMALPRCDSGADFSVATHPHLLLPLQEVQPTDSIGVGKG